MMSKVDFFAFPPFSVIPAVLTWIVNGPLSLSQVSFKEANHNASEPLGNTLDFK